MTSTFHGLEIGKRSLFTQQAAISTTGHNITNASTKGYSRQRVDMNATTPISYPYQTGSSSSQLGTGVTVQSIDRIRSEYLDGQFRERNSLLGSEEVELETLKQIEAVSGEPGEGGIAASLDRFWTSWEDLSSDPDSLAARTVLVERSEELLQQAKSFNSALSSMETDLTKRVTMMEDQVKSLNSQITVLNGEINRLGEGANDLKDRRDLLIDDLSRLVNIDVSNASDGSMKVTYDLSNPQSGQLKGLKDSADIVENTKADLNEMFNQLVSGKVEAEIGGKVKEYSGINEIMTSGYSLVTVDGTMQQGKALFDKKGTGSTLLDQLSINKEVKNNPAAIAASSKNDAISNGDIASAISDIKNTTFSFQVSGSTDTSNASINDYYNSIVSRLGSKTQSSERARSNHETILSSIDSNRMSVSGVSIDEEMANLVQFQHSYNAAARFISTTDELLDVIINRMGV